jgi:hypothetical protein
VGGTPPRGSQRKDEPEQAHRRPHAHIHFTEVDKDHHRRNGMRCQMMKLETVVLQQCEEEGGCRERELGYHGGGEFNDLIALLVGDRNGSASYPPIVLHHLPSLQSPHLPKVVVQPKTGFGETRRHGCRWRSESSSTEEEDRELKHKKANGKVISTLSRDSFSLPTLVTHGKTSCAAPSVDTPT